MKGRWAALGVVSGLGAFVAAGCGNGPDEDNGTPYPKAGGVTLKAYPDAGDWGPIGMPGLHAPNDLDAYMGESRAAELRLNSIDCLMTKHYCPDGWDEEHRKDPNKPADIRRIRVELYLHKLPQGAWKTFQSWHSGHSINDMGEKAFADADSIVFLRGQAVVRLVPVHFKPKTAAEPSVQVGKAIDAWLQDR
jgi:hypothetical protein